MSLQSVESVMLSRPDSRRLQSLCQNVTKVHYIVEKSDILRTTGSKADRSVVAEMNMYLCES
jgi:hypothetical protein